MAHFLLIAGAVLMFAAIVVHVWESLRSRRVSANARADREAAELLQALCGPRMAKPAPVPALAEAQEQAYRQVGAMSGQARGFLVSLVGEVMGQQAKRM